MVPTAIWFLIESGTGIDPGGTALPMEQPVSDQPFVIKWRRIGPDDNPDHESDDDVVRNQTHLE